MIISILKRGIRGDEQGVIMDLANILPAVEIGVPLYLVISYVVIISICILFIRLRLGLAVSFLFVFYIGYLYNRNILLETIKGSALGMLIYTISGFIIIILAIISFLSAPKK